MRRSRRSRRSAPQADETTLAPPEDATEENVVDEALQLTDGNGANWLSDLPDIRYPAIEDLREDPAVTGTTRDVGAPAAGPSRTTSGAQPGRAPIATGGDALIAHAAAAFEAVEEASSAAIARIQEFGRAIEESIDQLAAHRSAALERATGAHLGELGDVRNELRGSLNESIVGHASELEQLVAANSDRLVREHARKLEIATQEHTQRFETAVTVQIERLRQAGQEVVEKIATASDDETAHIERVTVDAQKRLEQIVARGARTRRLNMVALGVVAILAVVGLVFATTASGDVARPKLVDESTTTTSRVTTTTVPAITTLPAAPATDVPPPSTPPATSPGTSPPPATAPPGPAPTPTAPPDPLCRLLGLC